VILPNKVAIITGGARGMGGAVALKFADEGCSSVIVDIRDETANKTVEEIKKKGRDAIYVHCNVADRAEVYSMVEQAVNKFKKIDIMVNCAGIARTNEAEAGASFFDIDDEDWYKPMDVNCKGILYCCQAVGAHMRENKSGAIVNVVSIAALTPGPGALPYTTSKAAALHVSTSVALALAPYNIRVNTILPGMIRTDMTAVFAGPNVKDLDAHMAMAAKGIPLGREGTTEDIANVALFLVSDQSSYVTADKICVGGGNPYMAMPPR
jgi:glucose 1-dehydrogenase